MKLKAALAACLALVLLCGCPGARKDESRPASGGKTYGGTYRINEVGDVKSLDPVRINDQTSTHIASQLYDLLFDFSDRLELVPELAARYEVSPDGRTYTIHLRTDVTFHDDPCFPDGKGRKMVAADVKYSFERVCDSRTRTLVFDYFKDKVVGATEYFRATTQAGGGEPSVKGVAGFEASDDSTFRITLTAPFAPFLYHLAVSSMAIEPHEAIEKYQQDFFEHPVGTGAFQFASSKPGVECVLKRNPHYWQKDDAGNQLPYLDGVRFSFIQDEKTQLLEFRQGNLEEAYRVPTEFFRDIVDSNKKPVGDYAGFVLQHVPALSVQFYGFLQTSPVFKDARIRQAFEYAIDREKIVRFVLGGQPSGPATHGVVPPGMPRYPWSEVHGFTFDPVKAKTLLDEAGFPGGRAFPAVELTLNSGGGRNLQVAEAIQNMLKENLGVTVTMKQVEWAQHTTLVEEGKAPFYRLGWVADYPEPENFLQLFYGKLVPENDQPSSINSTRYRNAEFDELFERALRTLDEHERYALYAQAEQMVVSDAPVLFIYNDEDYKFVQPYVRGYVINAMDHRDLKSVWFERAAK
jgi:peptide/nickel transport system substrate-binding protein